MVTEKQLAAGLLFLVFCTGLAQAQDSAQPNSVFHIGRDGKPVFTQILRWLGDPNALDYEVTIKDGSNEPVLNQRTPETTLEVQLSPGSYKYQITTFNLLGQPKAATAWAAFEVIKAQQPVIKSEEPANLYLDAADTRITLRGSKLLPQAVIVLIDKEGREYKGTVASRKDNQEIIVVFPDDAYQPGDYTIRAQNPGGLTSTAPNTVRIRLQSPLDLLASLGYSPFYALADSWFVDNWSPPFHALGFDAQLDALFVKFRHDSFGLELGIENRTQTGGITNAALNSNFFLWGANVLYKHKFTRTIHGLLRLGGGISHSTHSFDYAGLEGPSVTSDDPFARLGVAVQVFFPWKFYGEAGIDTTGIFLIDHLGFGLTPRIAVGYQLF